MTHYCEALLPACGACSKSISGTYREITGGDVKWHSECFVCSVCNGDLTSGLQIKDGVLFCMEDYANLYGARCGGCQEVIKGSKLVGVKDFWIGFSSVIQYNCLLL
jgi:hypothetical protein